MNGQGVIDSIKSRLPGRTIGVYAVHYPASNDLVRSPVVGADDARAHVQATVARCPQTLDCRCGFAPAAGRTCDSATADARRPNRSVPELRIGHRSAGSKGSAGREFGRRRPTLGRRWRQDGAGTPRQTARTRQSLSFVSGFPGSVGIFARLNTFRLARHLRIVGRVRQIAESALLVGGDHLQ